VGELGPGCRVKRSTRGGSRAVRRVVNVRAGTVVVGPSDGLLDGLGEPYVPGQPEKGKGKKRGGAAAGSGHESGKAADQRGPFAVSTPLKSPEADATAVIFYRLSVWFVRKNDVDSAKKYWNKGSHQTVWCRGRFVAHREC